MSSKILKQIELEDDATPYGGISYASEDADNFVCEAIDPNYAAIKLSTLNNALTQCGIKPIKKNIVQKLVNFK